MDEDFREAKPCYEWSVLTVYLSGGDSIMW